MKIPNPQIWSCWKYIFSKKRGVYKSSWWLTGEAGDTVCGINDSWILVIYRRWMDVDLSRGIIGKCLCVFITMSITNGSLDPPTSSSTRPCNNFCTEQSKFDEITGYVKVQERSRATFSSLTQWRSSSGLLTFFLRYRAFY